MAKQFATMTPAHREFIARQQIFFTASATATSRVNISPRPTDAMRVLHERTVIYLDLTGSGSETAAHLRADGRITQPVSQTALNLLDVDRFGLDEIDQKIMMTILEKYRGGPVGVNTIAASISEEADTIEEVYEPYLIQLGFLNRTPRGRVATELAYEYFNVKPRHGNTLQPGLF